MSGRVVSLFFVIYMICLVIDGKAFAPNTVLAATSTSATKVTPGSKAELIIAEAEKMKGEAELKKAQVEGEKVALEEKKRVDAREQFFYGFIFRLIVVVVSGTTLLVLIPRLLPRVRKFGVAGVVEFELDQTLTSTRKTIRFIPDVPSGRDELKLGRKPNQPRNLSGPATHEYEKVTWHLYSLSSELEDPNNLDSKSKEQLRKIIKNAYSSASAMNHRSKALGFILYLRNFKDKELDDTEMLYVGSAYLWAALEEGVEAGTRQDFYVSAASFLRKAYYASALTDTRVSAAYNLGLVMLEIPDYKASIAWMERCIALNSEWSPWALWAIACAQTKLGKLDAAINSLSLIRRTHDFTETDWGRMWNDIGSDEYFLSLKNVPEYDRRLRELFARHRAALSATQLPAAEDAG